jgi:hypothetical protein
MRRGNGFENRNAELIKPIGVLIFASLLARQAEFMLMSLKSSSTVSLESPGSLE